MGILAAIGRAIKSIFAAIGRAIKSIFRLTQIPTQPAYPQPTQIPIQQPQIPQIAELAVPELAAVEPLIKELEEKKKKAKKKIFTVLKFLLYFILIIAIVGLLFWYFVFTTTGAYISSKTGGVFAPISEGLKHTASPLNQFIMILTGKYDPTEIWESKEYESQLQPYKDAGVYLEDVKPLRDLFSYGNDLIIIGKLKVINVYDPTYKDKGVNFSLKADGWRCTPNSERNIKTYFGRFECICSPGKNCYPDETEFIDKFIEKSVNINIEYDFKVVAGKQIYVATRDELDQLYLENKDPLSYYDISREVVRSWQTKSPVGLGIGVLGEGDIIAANEFGFESPYYIGFTVKNDGTGLLQSVKSFCVNLPIELNDSIKESDFNYVPVEGNMRVKWCANKNIPQLKPGEYETLFLKLKVQRNIILKGAPISSFFVKANLEYTYLDSHTVSFQIKKVEK